MIFYYALILVGAVIFMLAVINFFTAFKVKRSFENYLFLITSSKSYFAGAALFSFIIFSVTFYQSAKYPFDIRVFSILFFFFSLFLLSFSHFVFYMVLEKRLGDYREFFKKFDIDLKNRCQKLMLKHIYEKEKNTEKVKEIFKMNKHLCD